MSTHCTFYRTGKPMNSTLQPEFDASTDWEVDCNFFEPFDILSPEILLRDEGLGTAGPPINPKTNKPYHIMDYNYVYVQAPVERYYWINKWKRIQGIWHAYTAEDVLASFKDDILKTNQYVLRTSNPHLWDNSIPDTLYGYNYSGYISNTYYFDKPTSWLGGSNNEADRLNVVIGINAMYLKKKLSGSDPGGAQGTTTTNYFVTTLYQLRNTILPQIKYGGAGLNDTENIQLSNYITTIFKLPFEIQKNELYSTPITQGLSVIDLYYGNYDAYSKDSAKNETTNQGKLYDVLHFSAGTCYEIDPFKLVSRSFSLTDFIQQDIMYEYSQEYMSITLQFEPFGKIDLPVNQLILNTNSINISVDVQLGTGDAILYMETPGSDGYITLSTTNLSINYQYLSNSISMQSYRRQTIINGLNIAQSSINNIASSIQGSLHGATAGGPAGAIAGGVINGVTSALPVAESIWKAVDRPPAAVYSSVAGATGCALIASNPTLIIYKYRINGRDDNRFGRPICQNKKLSDLAGYFCLCQNAIFGGAGIGHKALATERAAIESALNGGVYLA